MQENKFEKQVREKMDKLHFDPEESVWSAIDQKINKKKKRRTPFFWLFLFGSLLCCGGFYYILTNQNILKKYIVKPEQPIQTGKTQSSSTEHLNGNATATLSAEPMISKTTQQKTIQQTKLSSLNSAPSSLEKNGKVISELEVAASDLAGQKNVPASATDTAIKILPADTISKREPARDSTVKKQVPSRKKSSWKFGLCADLGISNIYQTEHNNTLMSSAPGSPGGYYADNNPDNGFYFGAGFFFERDLNKRILVSAGLNYHYYSTHIQTGNYVNGIMILPGSYNGTASGYYTNGNQTDFTNQYHCLELPLSLECRLNPKKRPMYVEPSLSLGYLFASNAIYYETSGNIYVKNNEGIQPIQLNGGIAFLMGFNIQNNQLRLGPLFQYGFTSILKSQYGNPEHLIYGGLKIVFIPVKK